LPYVLFAYRTAVHKSTNETPFFLQHGFDAVVPGDLLMGNTHRRVNHETNISIAAKLRETYHLVSKVLDKEQERQKTKMDERARPNTGIKIGSAVMLKNEYIRPRTSAKFKPNFIGPYRVEEIDYPNVTIRPINGYRLRTHTVNLSRVKVLTDEDKFINAFAGGNVPNPNRCDRCNGHYVPSEQEWISCNRCTAWFHFKCAGLEEGPPDSLMWYCDACAPRFPLARSHIGGGYIP
jgi:hypothetical protein